MTKWYKGFGGPAVFNTLAPGFEAWSCLEPRHYGFSRKGFIAVFENGIAWLVFDEDKLLDFGRRAAEKLAGGFLETVLGEFGKRENRIDRIIARKEWTLLDEMSGEDVAGLYEELVRKYTEMFGWSVACEPVGRFLELQLRRRLKRLAGREKAAEVYFTLSAPETPSFLAENAAGLRKIAEAAGDNKAVLMKKLGEHAKKFFWIKNSYAGAHVLTADDFLQEVGEAKAGKLLVLPSAEEKKKLLDSIKAPDDLRGLVRVAGAFAELQDRRKKTILKAMHGFFAFLHELCSRRGLDMDEAVVLTLEEAVEAMRDGKRPELDERMKCVAVIWAEGKKVETIEGDTAVELRKKILATDAGAKVLKGTPACPGTAKGRVRLLLSLSDMHDFQDGEILIAANTTPEFVPAMRKAAAIVTEKGGVGCHAAIVSRELGIPCIVGVNSITGLVKDGDVLEVDAVKGVVKRLGVA